MSEKNNLYSRTLNKIKERRNRILSGKINCIPWGLPRFEEESPGIEQGKMFLTTANSKVTHIYNYILYTLPSIMVTLYITHLNIGETLT